METFPCVDEKAHTDPIARKIIHHYKLIFLPISVVFVFFLSRLLLCYCSKPATKNPIPQFGRTPSFSGYRRSPSFSPYLGLEHRTPTTLSVFNNIYNLLKIPKFAVGFAKL